MPYSEGVVIKTNYWIFLPGMFPSKKMSLAPTLDLLRVTEQPKKFCSGMNPLHSFLLLSYVFTLAVYTITAHFRTSK